MQNRNGRPPQDSPARNLLERARAGEPDAFLELVQPLDERLRALAYRILGDRACMDDALQEAYVRAYAGLARFAGRSAFSTWLYRITYNACLDELRRSSREEVPLDAGELAAEASERTLEQVGLAQALAALPIQLRALVLLVDAHGLSYREAAETLDIPPGTVASRLSRARGQLRESLQEVETP